MDHDRPPFATRGLLCERRLPALPVLALLLDDVSARWRAARRKAQVEALREELAFVRRQSAQLAAELRREARTDPLTGLANRRRWEEQLARELDRARRAGTGLAVAVVDLDRFKQVNDTLGHGAGDTLLREAARGFAGSVRSIDVLARLGGEEFGIALPEAALPDAVHIVERVRTSAPAGVTCSVGMAVWDGQESLRELQDRADAAMYRAKAAGRDRLVVA